MLPLGTSVSLLRSHRVRGGSSVSEPQECSLECRFPGPGPYPHLLISGVEELRELHFYPTTQMIPEAAQDPPASPPLLLSASPPSWAAHTRRVWPGSCQLGELLPTGARKCASREAEGRISPPRLLFFRPRFHLANWIFRCLLEVSVTEDRELKTDTNTSFPSPLHLKMLEQFRWKGQSPLFSFWKWKN